MKNKIIPKAGLNKFYLGIFISIIWIITFGFLYKVPAQSNSNSSAINPSENQIVLQADNQIFDVKSEPINTDQFPIAVINFSIFRKDGKPFYELKAQDIEAEIEGQRLEIKNDSLTKTAGEPIRILFMIDRSGSMYYNGKLDAAIDALRYFIANLEKPDEISIMMFDESYEAVVSPPLKVEKRSEIEGNIEGKIKLSNKACTFFYKAVNEAISQAERYKIKDIVFLSDGKEDTARCQAPPLEGKSKYKANQENEILSRLSRLNGHRFFSIAIGNPNTYSDDEGFVDFESMKVISESPDKAHLINTPHVEMRASKMGMETKQIIADDLKIILDKIKESIKFDYSLKLTLPQLKQDSGNLQLKLHLTDGKDRWIQPIDYPYSRKNGKLVFEKGIIGTPFIFIETAELGLADLSKIYLLFLTPLGLVSLCPLIFRKIASFRDDRKISNSIKVLSRNSELLGRMCPNEFTGGSIYAFTAGDTVIACPKCKVVHHLQCWEENQSFCMNKHCQKHFIVPSKVLKKYKT